MLLFQCHITPTRIRTEKKRNEDREPTIVDLRPFTGKSIVTFEDVPVAKTARRLIIVKNFEDETIKVTVTKIPKPEHNIVIEWSTNKIPPQSQINLEVVWSPLKAVSCRETIQISDNYGNKKDVAVILKSFEPKKLRKVGPSGYHKKLKLKTPSPPKHFNRPTSTAKSTVSTFFEYSESQSTHHQLTVSPLRNTTNVRVQQDVFERIQFSSHRTDKENSVPGTPGNASALFDNIHFTPKTQTKPRNESKLEYLSSLPTPKLGTRREDIVITDITSRRKLLELDNSPENVAPKRYSLSEQATPQFISRRLAPVPEIEITSHLRVNQTEIDGDTFVQNATTDEINEIELVISDRSLLGHTRVLSPLCVISEDEQLVVQKTFEVKSSSLTELAENVNSPHRVFSESMQEPNGQLRNEKLKANQGSMPNLNDMLVEADPIENNRYYHQQQQQNMSIESVVSNTDFREAEMCAQSSRLNIDELVSPIKTTVYEVKTLKSVKLSEDSPNRKSRPPSIHSSPTMRRIQLDPEFKSPPKTNLKMTFSPPSRSKLSVDVREMQRRETFDIPSGGRTIRATTWKQQQNQQIFAVPKVPRELNLRPSMLASQSLNSLSLTSIASACSTSSMPATLTKGRLYNENHLNAYNRNDPFSATTTIDPFLSSTMYLDEQTLDNIEKTYKKWLNALVTIPPDLESDRNEKIDVGKLFNDVQSKELTLAPTKEAVCSRYYTSRLDSLRNSAVQFFHSGAISMPLNKLTVMINEKNKLDIKAERNIHLDLVLQRSLLELLLCYNPLWLRIGLEVVFNVQLNLSSNHDIYGMSRFIITNLFKSQYLAEKYSKYSQQKEYLEKLRKHTVKNFLFVIFFLDRSKENRLIKQNPCLFVKRAPYKESAEILKKFASLVLANYGDIIRTLRRFEYIVNHKQTVIDEFDYAFKNLAVDLRDGVRLTKVMEIILMRDDLVQRVRVPGEFKITTRC